MQRGRYGRCCYSNYRFQWRQFSDHFRECCGEALAAGVHDEQQRAEAMAGQPRAVLVPWWVTAGNRCELDPEIVEKVLGKHVPHENHLGPCF